MDQEVVRPTSDVVAGNQMASDLFRCVSQELAHAGAYAGMTDDQRDEADARIWERVKDACAGAARTIATVAQTYATGTLKSAKTADNIVLTINLARNEKARHEINDAVGQDIMVVLSGEMAFPRAPGDTSGQLFDAAGNPVKPLDAYEPDPANEGAQQPEGAAA